MTVRTRRLMKRPPAERPGSYQDSARFTWDDAGELVLAAVSCPVCLTAEPVSWTYGRWGRQPYLDCICLNCDVRWYLRVSPEQLLRISVLDIVGAIPVTPQPRGARLPQRSKHRSQSLPGEA